ncbi:MAG: sialidase family protein [Terriglobales bacterium]
MNWNWNQRGRSLPSGESAAKLRLRAYRQKMAMRAARAAYANAMPATQNRALEGSTFGLPATSTPWVSVGPAPLASDATGDGGQDYNWVAGRATSVVVDPADTSGNTVLLGGAYGGLWKSTNAGSLNSNPAAVTWQPLIDDQPTLAVGAIALQPGNSSVILVGTGETNSSADSYYGLGILRSADGGATWTQIQTAGTGQSFLGVGFSKIAFSTVLPNVVVAATAGDNGLDLGLEEDGNSTARGVYFSQDAGVTWNRVILSDGAVPASATSVFYNANQGNAGTFYASIRRHGLYSSTDGQHFTRVTTQPTAGLASGNCPAGTNSSSCLIYRGEFTVVPGRNEMYVWVVDVQPDLEGNPAAVDEGIWLSLDGGATWNPIPDNGITNCGDDAFGPEDSGCGVEQGWYNLGLAAIPNGTGATDLYAGAINLYKCTLTGGTVCSQGDWINLTHVYGCSPLAAPAHVHPDQHGIAFMVANGKSPGYFAHDGGISRTLDGYADLSSGSCSGTNEFDSLSQSLGSMTEFVSVSIHPTSADILLGGTQDNGSPKTSTATSSSTWQNALGGDGGFNAINPANPNEWFASNPYLAILKCELGTACNDSGFVEVVSPANLGGDQGAFYTPYILDPQNSGELLVGTCRVWRITTSGSAPLALSEDFDTLGTGACTGEEINLVNALAAGGPNEVPSNSSVVYAVTNGYGPLSGSPGGEVWVTTNAGVAPMTNVTQNVNPNGYAISSVAMDQSDTSGNTAYVGIMGFSTSLYPTSHVWKTTSSGSVAWTDWTGAGATALPDAPVNALLVDAEAGLVYAGTDVGVFVSSTTAAPSWTEVGPAGGPGVTGFLPNAPVTALQMFHPDAGTKTLVASTYGRGIWNYALATAPNYTNVISNSPQTIFPTQTATFNGTLTAQGGYASLVNLSCSGAIPNTCTLQPTSAIPTAAYTLSAGGLVGDYGFNAHAVGTDGQMITRDASITLHVVDFNLTAPSPNSLTVGQGGTSSATTFEVTASGSFAGTVALSCSSGLPSGTACAFSPSSSVSPTSANPVTATLIVTADAGAAVGGPKIVTISATTAGAPAAKTQTFDLTVTEAVADFGIAVTANPNVAVANQTVTWNGTLTALNGYNGSVSLTCSGASPAMCATAPPTLVPTASGAAFTVTLANATTGAFNFVIQGSDGTITHTTATETLTVGTDVAWSNPGNSTETVGAGQTATYTFSAAPVGGSAFSAPVNFACGNTTFACQFSPASIAAGAGATTVTLTIPTQGPNQNSQSRPRLHAEGSVSFSQLLMLACVLAGTFVGIRGRRIGLLGLALAVMIELSCGGLSGGSGGGPPAIIVSVAPGVPSSVYDNSPGWPNQTAQFTATVSNTSNTSVTWAVATANGGTIDANGLYTAPNVGSGLPASVTITATSQADPSKSGSRQETLEPSTVPGTYGGILVTATEGSSAHSNSVTLVVQ